MDSRESAVRTNDHVWAQSENVTSTTIAIEGIDNQVEVPDNFEVGVDRATSAGHGISGWRIPEAVEHFKVAHQTRNFEVHITFTDFGVPGTLGDNVGVQVRSSRVRSAAAGAGASTTIVKL